MSRLWYWIERGADGRLARIEQEIDSDGTGGSWNDTSDGFTRAELERQASLGFTSGMSTDDIAPVGNQAEVVADGWVFDD